MWSRLWMSRAALEFAGARCIILLALLSVCVGGMLVPVSASAQTTHGPYTFDADNDSDEDAWTFVSDNGTNGLNPANTARAWSHDTNDTASTNVGPTSGQGGSPDGYVYTEASSPAAAGDTFTMTFDTTLDASSEDWEVDFYWNQRGDDNLATVEVQTNENSAGWVTQATYAENGPDVATGGTQVWNNETLDLGSAISDSSTQVRFLVTLGSTGNIWHNDFGLDTITITGTSIGPFEGTTLTGNVKFLQDLDILGSLSKGSGSFVIDHPLKPFTHLLFHSFVESPDVKNLYDGIVELDENGEATITFPEWFLPLNKDFRYQFFPLDEAMPNLHIKEEIDDEPQFTIAGGTAHGRVSWQVTGIRHDPYIKANPIEVEVEKGPDALVSKGECIFAPLCQ